MEGYGWDDVFRDGRASHFDRRILAEGDYEFEVIDFERKRIKSGLSAGENQALYTLLIDGEEVRYYLPLIESVRWKVSEFFRGVGIDIEGRRIPWDEAVGRHGMCHVRPRQYGDSSTFNDVARVWPKPETRRVNGTERRGWRDDSIPF